MTHSADQQLLARIDERTEAILKQLEKLNGTVARNERRISRLENWRSYTLGAIAVITIGGGIAVKIFF